MTKTIRFTKMHGLGNDYIYVNTMEFPIEHPEELAIEWSKPHTGIGSDGLILIGSSEVADFSMHIYNADGSEAMMCGNGTRCIGKYVYEAGLTDKTEVTLETLSGIKVIHLHTDGKKVVEVTVDMGAPVVEAVEQTLEAGGKAYTGTAVSMGNPHFVIFVEDITKVDLPTVGPLLEHHPYFPNRANIEFVEVIGEHEVRMRVWERGSGVTMACGTGACATAVASILSGRTTKPTQVVMDGGAVTIAWDGGDSHVMMTGGATTVYHGTIEI